MKAEVELLREAAKTMRARTNAATPGPWHAGSNGAVVHDGPNAAPYGSNWGTYVAPSVGAYSGRKPTAPDATHIASWHPAVALAVADWLDYAAGVLEHLEQRGHKPTDNGYTSRALAVAQTYLGRQP